MNQKKVENHCPKSYFFQAGNIISDIKTITEDVRIGFGGFVDKNLPPFARYRTDPSKLSTFVKYENYFSITVPAA